MGQSLQKLRRIIKQCRPRVLIRLTYPSNYPALTEALVHLERVIAYLKAQKNQGLWFRDTQPRGAPFFWLLVSCYVPKDQLAKKWFEIVGSNDPAHLKAGVSVSGFQYERGADQFLEKVILPAVRKTGFRYSTFGNWRARVLSWF